MNIYILKKYSRRFNKLSFFTSRSMFIIMLSFTLCSCKKFIQVDAPKNSLVPSTVFKSNELATSVLLGIYERMAFSDYASGNTRGISTICGLAGDELVGYGGDLLQIYTNEIIPENSSVSSMWTSMYARIYTANSILEGIETEDGITPPVKAQLKGEALFIRAFNYFYLVNLYGAVPLHLKTDYKLNSTATRSPVEVVYDQIIKDLTLSESLLSDSYISNDRVRPNKSAVRALLARVYLYLRDWEKAEKYSTLILDKTSVYKLGNLDQVFLYNSQEAIWQLMPAANGNTPTGTFLILTAAPSSGQVSLSTDFVLNAFELNDKRKNAWIKSIVGGSITYYYPFKYKIRSSTDVTEYIMVFRLAEQLLIRAEARAKQGNLIGAIDDVDAIRFRAGLQLIKNTNPTIDKDNLLMAIQKERKIELFSEWGDRWFDLKRTDKSTSVFEITKINWKPEYILFPVPKGEIDQNKRITQNDGY